LLKVQRTPQSPPSGLQWVLLAAIPLDEWISPSATQYVLELEAEGAGLLKPMAPMSEISLMPTGPKGEKRPADVLGKRRFKPFH
jgi:hypothetical protein